MKATGALCNNAQAKDEIQKDRKKYPHNCFKVMAINGIVSENPKYFRQPAQVIFLKLWKSECG
jgi:hypothetical protein